MRDTRMSLASFERLAARGNLVPVWRELPGDTETPVSAFLKLPTPSHGASLTAGRFGVLHGSASSVLQTDDGQVAEAHSVSAGLDYPGVGPELAQLRDAGRLDVRTATDDEAIAALQQCCRLEGILPALETAHALARARDVARELGRGRLLLVNLSGRGDKDLLHVLAEIERRTGART